MTLERMSGLFGSFSMMPSTGETRGTRGSNTEVSQRMIFPNLYNYSFNLKFIDIFF